MWTLVGLGTMLWMVVTRVWNQNVDRIANERGKGSDPQPAQIIQAPAPPSVSDTAAQSAQAQLQYNPQLTQQALDLQRQFGGQFAQSQYDITAQQAPLQKALLMQMYPGLATYEQQVNQRLASPTGYSNQQQQALDAIRQRETDRGLRGIREGANLGGTLYGGRRQQAESDYLTQQGQAYSAQDIGFQQQQQAANQQALISLLQLSNPQVSQVNVPQYGQSVVPGGDNFYNALVQNQGNFGVIPGTPAGPNWFQSFMGGFR